jgi:iron complex outermembrane receptor protein
LAAINVPVAPDLSLRVSGSRSGEERGYFYNSTLGHRVGTSDNDYLHGVLRYDPGSKLQITLSADYNRLDSDGAYLVDPNDEPYETAAGLYAARLPFNKDTLNTTQTPLKLYDNSIEYGVSLNAKYDLTDEIYVRSITAYRHNSVTPELDINNEGVALDVDTSGSQVTEELQIGGKAFDDKLDFIGGVYYFHEDSHQNWIVAIPLADFYIQNTYAAILTDSEAAYAQATYSVMPWLRLTAGARYSHDEKTLGVNSTLGAAYNTATLIANGIPTSISANKLTPKFGIEADLADDVLGYFTYTKGFKGGGFNATSGNFRDDVPFAPESVEAYELGLKTQWFGNRLRVNTALFENNLSNAQFDFLVPGTGDIDQGNVASATIKGVELESSAVLSSGWTAFGYVDYTYNVIDSVSPLALEAAIRPGNQLKDTPKWKYQIGTAYSTPLNFIPGAVTFRGTWTWTGKSFNLPTDDPTEVVPSHGKFDIRIRYESENGDWYAQLEGDNITNDRYQIARLTVLPTVPAQANLPAQFGVRFGTSF